MKYIIGSDEVGYGAWAGPMYVCAVAVPVLWAPPEGLNDSKKLTERQRTQLMTELLQAIPLTDVMLISVGVDVIDKMGVGHALRGGHVQVLTTLKARHPDSDAIVDGNMKLPILWAKSVPKADGLYPAVMAASIIAKTNRDAAMKAFNKMYPGYGFDYGVGYGTPAHQAGLEKLGVCPIHRRSYAPIKRILEKHP
jgi:ribonuclease HII